jgi:hypothetical protein
VSVVKLSPQVLQAVDLLAKALRGSGVKWLVGGSCGLLFHGIDLTQEPGDLDIYLDVKDVSALYRALQIWAIDEPTTSTTEIYTSTLSHYRAADMQIEAVGGFSVHKNGSLYQTEARYLMQHHALHAEVQGSIVAVMPLAHELLFNMLRSRPDRYEPVAAAMLLKPETHLPILKKLIERNQWEPGFLLQLDKLMGIDLHKLDN